jgi:hypothetical protein
MPRLLKFVNDIVSGVSVHIRAELCKERFLRIHEVLVKNLKKNERLKQEAKDLHTKLTLEINKFENA